MASAAFASGEIPKCQNLLFWEFILDKQNIFIIIILNNKNLTSDVVVMNAAICSNYTAGNFPKLLLGKFPFCMSLPP
jgi:hypothetical protein